MGSVIVERQLPHVAPRTLEPVVLLHGLAGTIRQWDSLVDALGSRYRVLVPGLAGHLEGPALPPGEISIVRTPADQVERELDALGIRSAHFVGSSLGGAVALELAKRGRARSVVAIAPAGAIDPGAAERRRVQKFFRDGRRAISVLGPTANAAMKFRAARWLFFRQSVARPTELDPAGAAHALRAFAAPAKVLIERVTEEEITPDLDRVRCPVLLLWGDRDRIVPFASWGRPVADALPHAELHIIAGLSHLPMIDDPALVADAVVAFTERLAAPTSERISAAAVARSRANVASSAGGADDT